MVDRVIVYAGAIPLETDILHTNKNAMVSIGALAAALFGATTSANGMAVTPTVNAGRIPGQRGGVNAGHC